MREGSSSKSTGLATVGKDATLSPSKTIKKERSLRSLFSFFKAFKHDKKPPSVPEPNYPNNRPFTKAPGFSTASLPARTSTREDEDDDGNPDNDFPRAICHCHSTTSLPSQIRPPFARHSPTPSSSSDSSFEFSSDVSTAATSPSNSSPSVLIKSLSSVSVATADSATSVASPIEHNSPQNQTSTKPPGMAKTSKRVSDSYQKQPSPLSSVMDAHSPYTPQISTQDYQPKRRSYLGNLLRRSQSHPDLADLTQADLPPLPPMPTLASSTQPVSPASISRAKSFRKKFGDSKKSGGFGGYTDQEKIERMSILGADPAGYGYYLYPTSEKEAFNKRNSGTGPPGRPGYAGDWKRDNRGPHPDGPGGGRGANGSPRGWKDGRGRGFRKTVAQQAIPEESSDAVDSESMMSQSDKPNRRFSNPNPVSTLEVMKERRQSLHNSWDLIQAHQKIQEFSSLQVPRAKAKVLDQDDEAVLRELQQGALRAMDAADSAIEEFNGNIINLSLPNPGGSGEQAEVVEMKDNLPMIRIDVVEA